MAKLRDVTVSSRKSAKNPSYMQETDTDSPDVEIVPGRKRKHRRFFLLHMLFRLMIVGVLILAGIYIWKNWEDIAPENVVIWLNEVLAGGQSGDGFPVDIAGSSVLNMTETSEGLAVLTDTSFLMYNGNGGKVVERQHGFSKPIMKAAGKWVLVAEAGGSRVRMETRASTAVDMTAKNKIVGIAVNKNGDFALATDSSHGYTSEVTVYDRDKKELYHWYSSDLTVVDVALSADGGSMAVAGITADSGAMKSDLLFFDFHKTKPVAEYKDTGLLVFAVRYFDDGMVAAMGDQALWVVSSDGAVSKKQSYDDRILIGYALSDNTVTAVLRNYGSADGGLLLAVNSKGEKQYSVSFEGTFRSVAPCRSGILLMTSDHLYRTNAAGIRYTENAVEDGRMISSFGGRAAVLGLTKLNLYTIPSSGGTPSSQSG